MENAILQDAISSTHVMTDHAAVSVVRTTSLDNNRITVRGKFLYQGDSKFWVKGVTYGTFRPDGEGNQFPEPGVVATDFASMAGNGINTVRTYTPPPRWLLDIAQDNGLRVMVGIAWEQHVTFLDDERLVSAIEDRIRDAIRVSARHPALLCYSIGNEIPASIVRWHGRQRVEGFIKRLYRISKQEDPDALVTYVNYPTTEYLQLPFLDICCFNVYLETRERLDAYLARLQNLAGDRPLLMAEIGLDSRRNGEGVQAESLTWQVRTAFAAGCTGAFVFAWTDEWYRGGHDIDDWDFGLTSRSRQEKPALAAVKKVFAELPFPGDMDWPRVSVVVCSYNGSATIRDTLEGLMALDYPNFEVIVVNDGSTDTTPAIAGEYAVRLISTENRGLSNARNTGWQAADGEIIAYIDDDAYPDPHWLQYLAHTFMTTEYMGVGGPNIAPADDGPVADCVANAPGRPVHVLLSDREAEHIPGCNMAFRREALQAIGGFDPRYRAAGDDVDVCWRVQEQGWKIGFHAAAMDWHHCRNSIRTYWKQQQGYGKAEALLEEKWPEKYNTAGHFSWRGRLYGKGITASIPTGRWHIYQGKWGSALFQSIYEPSSGMLASLPLMPEWYFVIGLFGFLALLGLAWSPLLWVFPLLLGAIIAPLVQAVLSAMKAEFPTPRWTAWQRLGLRGLTALLHLAQPLARLIGRLRFGLSMWRNRTGEAAGLGFAKFSRPTVWSETWHSADDWLGLLCTRLVTEKIPFKNGGDYDNWDLQVNGGLLGGARLVMAIEEHGEGKQLLKFSVRRLFPVAASLLLALFASLCLAATLDKAWLAAGVLGSIASMLAARIIYEAASSAAVFSDTIRYLQKETGNG